MTQATAPDNNSQAKQALWPAPSSSAARQKSPLLAISDWVVLVGFTLSALWIALCLAYIGNTVGFTALLQSSPGEIGGFLAGIATLPTLLWVALGQWQRMAAFKSATASLQAQLQILITPEANSEQRAESLAEALRRQADIFTTASQGAIASLRTARGALRQEAAELQKSAGETTSHMNEETGRMRDLSQDINGRFERLNTMLTKGAIQYETAQERLVKGTSELETLATGSSRLFEEFGEKLDDQIHLIGIATKIIRVGHEEADSAFDSIRHGTESVGRELGMLGERTRGLGTHLDGLRNAVSTGVTDVVEHSDRLQRRSESLSTTLTEQGRQIDQAMEKVVQVTTALGASSTLIGTTGDQLRESADTACENLSKVAVDLQKRENALVSTGKSSAATLREAMATLDETVHRSGVALGGLDRKAGEINFAVTASLNRITDLTGGLSQSEAAISSASDHASAKLETTSRELTQQVEVIRSLNQQLEDVASQATQSLDKVGDAGRLAEGKLHQLDQATRHHNTLLDEQLDRLAKTGAAGERISDAFSTISHDLTRNSAVLDEMLAGNASRLGDVQKTIHQTTEAVDASVGKIADRSTDMERAVGGMMARLEALQQDLANARSEIEQSVGNSAEKLGTVGEALRSEFSTVRDDANRALERLEHLVSSLATGSVTAASANDQAEERLRKALSLMQQNGQAFNTAIDMAMAGIQRAEQVLTDEQENLGRTAEAAAIRFSRLGQDLAANSFDLTNTVATSVERLNGISSAVDQNIGSLVSHVTQAEIVVKAYSESVEGLAGRGQDLTSTLQAQSEILRDNIKVLGATVTEVQEKSRLSAQAVTVEAAELAANADKAKTNIGGVIDRLKEQSRVLSETEADSRAMAGRVTTMLGEKALELANAARAAANETTHLREMDAKVRRDLFLNATKTVLDGLQSLSVDLTRVLERDLPEKSWKNTPRSEIAGFTKRLVNLRDHLPDGEVRGKFLTDNQFRTDVQLYLHQFESLLEQAMANDQGDILSSTLMSSDVGKIYYFLSSSIGHERSALQRAG